MHPLDILWNGWRAAYITGDAGRWPGEGSVFTRILAADLPDVETNILHRGDHCFVIMNAFPYSSGHLLVLPYREVGHLELLSQDETTEIWATVTSAVVAVKAALCPGGVNVGINLGRPAGGSVAEHLHVHVVPRWNGDANFMTSVANARGIPEALQDTAAKIRSAWP